MNKVRWKEIVGKTKWASQKKRFGKKELSKLMDNALTLEKFMDNSKSEFADVNRREPERRREPGKFMKVYTQQSPTIIKTPESERFKGTGKSGKDIIAGVKG